MTKKLLFSLIVLITFSVHSQQLRPIANTNPYWKGEIELDNGTIKKGLVQVPHSSKIKKVAFKTSENAKKETFKRKEVASVKVTSNAGKNYLYECVPVIYAAGDGMSWGGKSLLLVEAKNNYVTFYIETGYYLVDKKTAEISLVYFYEFGKDTPTTSRFIRKRGAEKANLFYMTGYVGGFRKLARHHLTEDEELLEKIENRTLKIKDIPEIIATYIDSTESL